MSNRKNLKGLVADPVVSFYFGDTEFTYTSRFSSFVKQYSIDKLEGLLKDNIFPDGKRVTFDDNVRDLIANYVKERKATVGQGDNPVIKEGR